MNKIITDGTRLIDSAGRERIFNGVNICDKGVFNSEKGVREYGMLWEKGLARKLKEKGFNLVRLGITWDAVEPEKGVYNEEYIEKIISIINECEKNKIYVYLDMHQDLYSGFGDGCGDGAPSWATITDKYKYHKEKFVWAEGYFWGKAVHRAFDNFWNNKNDIQTEYFKMWKHLASRTGNSDYILGYDVMNEPFPGKDGGKVFARIVAGVVKVTLTDCSIKKRKIIKYSLSNKNRHKILDFYNGEILRKITSSADSIIKKFDTEKYSPFINRAADALCRDSEKIIIMENSYYSNLGIPYSCPVPEIDGEKVKNAVFAPHAYDFMVDTPSYKYASNERIKAIFDEHKRSQERLGLPVIVGEWGGFTEGNEWFGHIKFLLDLFDKNHWSSTYWCYFKGFLESELVNTVLCRPYPIAVTGEIKEYNYDRRNNTFTILYNQKKEYEFPTEIFLNSLPKEIITDGDYTVEPINEKASVLVVKTALGDNRITVVF